MNKLLEKIFQLNSLAIVGIEKNVGKTTTMNYIIEKAKGKYSLGLTSIGIDGEKEDQVTGTEKPTIYIQKGTIIASAKKSYLSSDITKEILSTTGIQTPMGEIILFRALSDGYIELMGPSINNYLKTVIKQMKALGSQLVIVDGALNRRTTASPSIAEGVIVATGATVSRNMEEVIEETAHKVSLLQIELERNYDRLKLVKKALKQGKVSFLYDDKLQISQELTALGAENTINEGLTSGANAVIISGVVGDRLVENLIKSPIDLSDKIIYVEDGTKLFLKEENLRRLKLKGLKLMGVNEINLLLITVNPKAPDGYSFDSHRFCYLLHEKTQIPVFDVISNIGVGLE